MVVWSKDRYVPEEAWGEQERKEQEKAKANSEKIISLLEELRTKIDDQTVLLRKVASTVTKLYLEGEINQDTFNKLDIFLREYYESVPES